jgi:hypothetical protein
MLSVLFIQQRCFNELDYIAPIEKVDDHEW